jgi:heme/copper-type cytochrome/quinol oxidase subunit 4
MNEEMKEHQVGAVIVFLFTVAIAFTIAIGVILSWDAVALIGLAAFVWAAVFLRIKEEMKEDEDHVGAVILLLFTVAIAFTIAIGVILS